LAEADRVSETFVIEVREDGTGLVGVLVGELDMSAARTVREYVATVLSIDDRDVALDLAHVTFIDSAGLTALLEARRYLDARGRVLRLRGVSAPVSRLIGLTGVGSVFASCGQ
jgi:anti-sigma B factor antagonist